MKIKIAGILFCFIAALTGCQQSQSPNGNQLFVVEFEKNKPLKYKMVSSRDIVVKFDGAETKKKSKDSEWKMSETLEIDAVLTLEEIDSRGLLTVKAEYPNVTVTRKGKSRSSGKDAIENLRGQSVTFKMTPAGKLVETSQLEELIQSLGDKAFGASSKSADIKSQDMVADFVALQWYMFDPVANITNPLAGVEPGDTWTSVMNVPAPLQLFTERTAEYSLDEVITEDKNSKAIISVKYQMTDADLDTPLIYSGRAYRQRGFFGVLRCKPISLEGTGKIKYNLDKGILENTTQQYQLITTAVLFMPLPGTEDSKMTIDQKFSIELVK